MKSLASYIIFENDISEITNMISTINSLKDLAAAFDSFDDNDMGDKEDQMKAHYVSRTLDRLLKDQEVTKWFASTNNDELSLRRLLAKKLSPREARYMDDICTKLTNMDDDDSDIINNAIIRLMVDRDIINWHKSKGDQFDLYDLLIKKLNSKEKQQIQEISNKLLELTARIRR